MSLSDDELKKLQVQALAGVPFGNHQVSAIIDEALSRGAQRPMVCDDCRKEAGICVCTGCWEKAKTKARDADSDAFILALTELSRERDEARAALTMADKNFGVIYEGQRAALAKAKQERDAARAVTAEVQGAFGLAKSNARAAVIEECREKAKQMGEWGFADVLTRLHSVAPSGQWVAADVMEKVKAALSEHSCDHCPGCEFPHGTSDEGDVAQLRAALSALEASR